MRNPAFRIAIGGLTMAVVLCLVAAISLWKVPTSVQSTDSIAAEDIPQDSTIPSPIQLAHDGEVDGLMRDAPQRPVPEPQDFVDQPPLGQLPPDMAIAASNTTHVAAPGEPTESALPIEAELSASPAVTEPTTTENASAAESQTAATRDMEAEIAALKGQINELARSQLERQLAEIRHAEQLLSSHQSTRMIEALQREVDQLKEERLAGTQTATEAADADALTEPTTSPAEDLPVQNSEPVVELGPMQDNQSVAESPDTAVRYTESTEMPGRYDVEADDATLQEFVAKLGPVAGWNLVSGPELTGHVTLRWSRVDLRQALTHQLKARGWQIREEGEFAIIEAYSTTTTRTANAESIHRDDSHMTMSAPITLQLAPGAAEGSTYDQSTGIRIQPGTSSRSIPVSRSRILDASNSKPPVQMPTQRISTPPPASATHEPQTEPAPLLMNKSPAPAAVPVQESAPSLTPAPISAPALIPLQDQVQAPALVPPPAPAETTPVAATQNDLTPSTNKIEIEATIIETLTPQRPAQGILPQTIAISGHGPCPTCGQIHSLEEVPFGHACDGWFEMNEGIRCGVCSMAPELIIARLKQVSQATVTSNPRVQVLPRQIAEIGLTEKQGFRRISSRQKGETNQYALLQGGVELALCPTLEDNGVIRLDLNPIAAASGISTDSANDRSASKTSLSIPPGSCAVIGGLYFGIEQPSDIDSRSKRIGSILTGKFSDNEIREVVVVIRVRSSNETEPVASPASLTTESEEPQAPAPLLIPATASPIPQ